MAGFKISRSFYSAPAASTPRAGTRAVARTGHAGGTSGRKSKLISAALVVGTAGGLQFADKAFGGLPSVKFNKEDPSAVINQFGTADFLGGAALLGLSLWGKLGKYDSYLTDVAKGSLALWSVHFGDSMGNKYKAEKAKTAGVAGNRGPNQMVAGRPAVSPEQAWQHQFNGQG